ncbi:HD-GYP domain-containing protein [Cohnella zeiphila]|uniref:HD domain-containing protein n=1 Tax=Cohnella zeiphila TaxID=2761120 RepID=A0A7X0VYI1_9BACL|nr:HD domain-containing phosphohydrolase [Cohnella zeiphila]MBB6732968.1 HD domain-containing protein [Cohnella zeiphila]
MTIYAAAEPIGEKGGEMREIHVDDLQSGDVLERTVFGKNGIVMLEAGTVLTPYYIDRLRTLGFRRVAVKGRSGVHSAPDAAQAWKRSREQAEEEILTWNTAAIDRMKDDARAVADTMDAVRWFAESEQTFDRLSLPYAETARFRREFRERVLEAMAQPAIAQEMSVLQQTDTQLFEHSLQVTLLSNIAADLNGFDRSRLQELTIGSLLFDVGMTRLPERLIKAQRKLTDSERSLVRQHTKVGYKVLSSIREVPQQAARSALLHHERYNGGGYPLGFKGGDIPEMAQIIGLADVYDALISKRHHRDPYPNIEAMEYLFAAGNYDFGIGMIRLFLKHIAVFPVSSVVLLSTGQMGVVENVDNRLAHRPIVRIIREADGHPTPVPYTLDLNLNRNVVILHTVPWDRTLV